MAITIGTCFWLRPCTSSTITNMNDSLERVPREQCLVEGHECTYGIESAIMSQPLTRNNQPCYTLSVIVEVTNSVHGSTHFLFGSRRKWAELGSRDPGVIRGQLGPQGSTVIRTLDRNGIPTNSTYQIRGSGQPGKATGKMDDVMIADTSFFFFFFPSDYSAEFGAPEGF